MLSEDQNNLFGLTVTTEPFKFFFFFLHIAWSVHYIHTGVKTGKQSKASTFHLKRC